MWKIVAIGRFTIGLARRVDVEEDMPARGAATVLVKSRISDI
jgi:hypothetical protein